MPEEAAWAVPGVPLPRPAPDPAPDVAPLLQAVEQALAVDPALLPAPVALERTRQLLVATERLHAAVLQGVADVDARDLWALAAAGSTRTWLRTLPSGDRGQLADARALADAPLLAQALAEGTVALRTATALARQLARLPLSVPEAELQAALVDGSAHLLAAWSGAACPEPTDAQQAEHVARRDRVAQAVKAGLAAACWGSAAQALEPVAVLLAEALPPTDADAALGLLVDALQPEADLDATAEQEYRSRDLVLRKLKGGGWSLRGHLTDETGQLLHEELRARERQSPAADTDADADADRAPEGRETGDLDRLARHGQAGPGLEPLTDGARAPGRRPPVEGSPQCTPSQRAHDALAALLHDLAAVTPGSGRPSPASLTVTATLAALAGEPGAPPGLLQTARGVVPLTPAALRRHGCDPRLSAVLLDALGRPVGASGEHRHATERERRVLVAVWGHDCAVNGCGGPGTVPHHVDRYAVSGCTRLPDLVPVCTHHHHDVHEGKKTLRLRDGRLIDESGWLHAAGW